MPAKRKRTPSKSAAAKKKVKRSKKETKKKKPARCVEDSVVLRKIKSYRVTLSKLALPEGKLSDKEISFVKAINNINAPVSLRDVQAARSLQRKVASRTGKPKKRVNAYALYIKDYAHELSKTGVKMKIDSETAKKLSVAWKASEAIREKFRLMIQDATDSKESTAVAV